MSADTSLQGRPIPVTLAITTFMHCHNCMSQKPVDVAPRDWASLNVGFTKLGVQVWCVRCNMNVCHIDFQGQQHPANLTAKKYS